MRKDFGKQNWFFPEPVLIIGTYDEDGTPNAMNAAWGGVWDYDKIYISLSEHKTTKNLRLKKCFTLSFADAKHVIQADYVGIVSGNQVKDKIAKCGLKTQKSNFIDAPIFTDFPLCLECVVDSFEDGNLIGQIVNTSADQSVLDESGKVDISKLNLITYEPITHKYVALGEVVGNAFSDGKKLK